MGPTPRGWWFFLYHVKPLYHAVSRYLLYLVKPPYHRIKYPLYHPKPLYHAVSPYQATVVSRRITVSHQNRHPLGVGPTVQQVEFLLNSLFLKCYYVIRCCSVGIPE